ncbi:DNA mismatch repair protein MutS [Martelella sp. HB161492]|uniref:MutS-related protein n=1 Tax=Martelella sp. HB161492 TaxID=2720726 RepID=UPI00159242C6|nr:DNA mismatch repair protein MutS [Martelella sp. HB161492]
MAEESGISCKLSDGKQDGQPSGEMTGAGRGSGTEKGLGHKLSILQPDGSEAVVTAAMPACFHDINFDQFEHSLTSGRMRFHLDAVLRAGPVSPETAYFRQRVMKDLEREKILPLARALMSGMTNIRDKFDRIEKLRYLHQKTALFLETADIYGRMVDALAKGLSAATLQSEGLSAFADFLAGYTGSEEFRQLRADIESLQAQLGAVRYSVLIRGDTVTVARYSNEEDYSAEILEIFKRFRLAEAEVPKFSTQDSFEMDHVEAGILDGVRHLYPAVFDALEQFFASRRDLVHPMLVRFERELQFYVAYIDYIAPLRRAGLDFCYPKLAERSEGISAEGAFDIVLARKLTQDKRPVIANDFFLERAERIFVVSGPNQGGKTTFARMFGQLHYLAGLGLPVPGKRARLARFDSVFTHFERQEDIHDLKGKLQDDLERIHEILANATGDSIIIMNEIFTSTTLRDALFLGTRILEKIEALGARAVCVTFIDELSRLGPATVSMVSAVDPDDPSERTYKILRRPADGHAYAMAIAEKHRLTPNALRERMRT